MTRFERMAQLMDEANTIVGHVRFVLEKGRGYMIADSDHGTATYGTNLDHILQSDEYAAAFGIFQSNPFFPLTSPAP